MLISQHFLLGHKQ